MPDLTPLRPALQGGGHHADLGVRVEAEGRLEEAEHALLQQQYIALAELRGAAPQVSKVVGERHVVWLQ
jgi:hypothetical protein